MTLHFDFSGCILAQEIDSAIFDVGMISGLRHEDEIIDAPCPDEVVCLFIDDDVAVDGHHECHDLSNVFSAQLVKMLDLICLLCPEITAVHADGEIELKAQIPESGFIDRVCFVKGSAGRDSDESEKSFARLDYHGHLPR